MKVIATPIFEITGKYLITSGYHGITAYEKEYEFTEKSRSDKYVVGRIKDDKGKDYPICLTLPDYQSVSFNNPNRIKAFRSLKKRLKYSY